MSAALFIAAYVIVSLLCTVVAALMMAEHDRSDVSVNEVGPALFFGFGWPVLLPFALVAVGLTFVIRRTQAVTR